MNCNSCNGSYDGDDGGTCKDCHEALKAKVAFLRLCSPSSVESHPASFSDVVLFASRGGSAPVPAHKAVLVSRSPVFRAMLENEMEESLSGTTKIADIENEMEESLNGTIKIVDIENKIEESLSGTIKIADVSYDALRAFVNYLYTAEPEICDDRTLACDLLILAEKYQVHHLKDYCQKFLVSNLNWDNALMTYTFAHQHNAKRLIDAALTLIIDNMDKLTAKEDYAELKKKDPQLLFEIYEAYISSKVTNKAAPQPAAPQPAAPPPAYVDCPAASIC